MAPFLVFRTECRKYPTLRAVLRVRWIRKCQHGGIGAVLNVQLLAVLVRVASFSTHDGLSEVLERIGASGEVCETALVVAVTESNDADVATAHRIWHVALLGDALLDGLLALADFCRLCLGTVGIDTRLVIARIFTL